MVLDHCSITDTLNIEVDGKNDWHFNDAEFRTVLKAAKKIGFYRSSFEAEKA